MPLTEENGIDILGNLMESSLISRNRAYYGDLHNMGHVFISYAHDPDHRHLVRQCILYYFYFRPYTQKSGAMCLFSYFTLMAPGYPAEERSQTVVILYRDSDKT